MRKIFLIYFSLFGIIFSIYIKNYPKLLASQNNPIVLFKGPLKCIKSSTYNPKFKYPLNTYQTKVLFSKIPNLYSYLAEERGKFYFGCEIEISKTLKLLQIIHLEPYHGFDSIHQQFLLLIEDNKTIKDVLPVQYEWNLSNADARIDPIEKYTIFVSNFEAFFERKQVKLISFNRIEIKDKSYIHIIENFYSILPLGKFKLDSTYHQKKLLPDFD